MAKMGFWGVCAADKMMCDNAYQEHVYTGEMYGFTKREYKKLSENKNIQ